ncbi:hypothetical protein VNI00_011407 [Paramarasmius palmivorus]|uniref:Cupredoxin n=1 Tax=Paramarasmius palmivorus TaxID=297713 RepID=A0AAW0CCT3_9AGAR
MRGLARRRLTASVRDILAFLESLDDSASIPSYSRRRNCLDSRGSIYPRYAQETVWQSPIPVSVFKRQDTGYAFTYPHFLLCSISREMFLFTSSILALAGLAVAQNQTIDVNVGGVQARGENIFMFSPSTITAQVGDVVSYAGTFQNPCQPMPGGFDSGWVFIPTNGIPADTDPIWNLTITNTTNPIWFFCKQLVPLPHCTTGMVGAINAPTSGDNTFDNYKSNAAKDTSPGQGVGALVGNGASASAVPGPITNGAMFAGSPAATPVSTSAGTAPSTGGGSTSGGYKLRVDAMVYLGAVAAIGLLA